MQIGSCLVPGVIGRYTLRRRLSSTAQSDRDIEAFILQLDLWLRWRAKVGLGGGDGSSKAVDWEAFGTCRHPLHLQVNRHIKLAWMHAYAAPIFLSNLTWGSHAEDPMLWLLFQLLALLLGKQNLQRWAEVAPRLDHFGDVGFLHELFTPQFQIMVVSIQLAAPHAVGQHV